MNKSYMIWEIFWRFLWLGCISFGGPAAHIAYFYRYFVDRLGWLSADNYGKLVALSQFLPGPGSSQVGFAIGLERAGWAGGIAAFMGFTLPSFSLMLMLAYFSLTPQMPQWLNDITVGLSLLAAVVVSDAVLTMFGHFCRKQSTRIIALLSALVLLAVNSLGAQLGIFLLAAVVSFIWPHLFTGTPPRSVTHTSQQAKTRLALLIFATLFSASLLLLYYPGTATNVYLSLAAQFYQSGSLVFGGGHVVLPLLQASVGDSLNHQQFMLGYAAAQGVPGPMFSMAAFMGAQLSPWAPVLGAITATLALFLPGLLLVYALHHHWQHWAHHPRIAAVSVALNATVVGLLFSALAEPILPHAVRQPSDIVAMLLGLLLLRWRKPPILLLIVLFIAYAFVVGQI